MDHHRGTLLPVFLGAHTLFYVITYSLLCNYLIEHGGRGRILNIYLMSCYVIETGLLELTVEGSAPYKLVVMTNFFAGQMAIHQRCLTDYYHIWRLSD